MPNEKIIEKLEIDVKHLSDTLVGEKINHEITTRALLLACNEDAWRKIWDDAQEGYGMDKVTAETWAKDFTEQARKEYYAGQDTDNA